MITRDWRDKKTAIALSFVLAVNVFHLHSVPAQEVKNSAKDDQKVDWALFLPSGEGQFQTAVYCSTCHSLRQIVAEHRADEAGWKTTVQTMASTSNANIQEEDIPVIAKYLAQSFPPATPKLQIPIQINTASKETLRLMGALSQSDVQKILDAREKGAFADLAALEALVGAGKLAKYKPYISFRSESRPSGSNARRWLGWIGAIEGSFLTFCEKRQVLWKAGYAKN